ncbi:AAA family ATPase, partial [Klebsiella pneumoniae]|nr:AAA family ATPase [Klebsiella pneumoniae]
MSRTIMLIPAEPGIGLTRVSLGVIRAMERKGVRLRVYKPMAHARDENAVPNR